MDLMGVLHFALVLVTLRARVLAPMMRDGKLPCNERIGIKTRHTRANDTAWSEDHHAAAPQLVRAGRAGQLVLLAAALLCLPGWFTVAFALTGAGYLVVPTFLVVSGQDANRVAKPFANEAEPVPEQDQPCRSREPRKFGTFDLLPDAIHVSSVLYMSAAREDLTGRARLRDAAIECFAAHGFDESLRAIAARAGVSAGLVRHHFGSKEALRAECDATVLARYRTLKNESLKTPPQQLFARFPSSREGGVLLVYILRSVRAGGDAGRDFIEHLVTENLKISRDAVERGIIVPSCDEEARVRLLVQQSVGAMVVSFAMRPERPLDDFGAVMDRYYAEAVLPTLELYTEGLFTTREYLDEYLAFLAGTRNPPAGLAGDTVTR
ncbi:TetR family transcriptional regulator [Paeniglutamicibacter gangotriensis]|uniref:TetR family transcriptional regulator n=1 Tax=Paeniglutamicibacter gangotriensis TaxID=254787 RepID=UPI0037C67560